MFELLHTEEYFYILDTQLTEYKHLKRLVDTLTERIEVNYLRFKGVGPVSDRDFVLVERGLLEGNKYYHAAASCDHPFSDVKGVVRGECFIGGYIAEKIDEKTLKVTYISDGDIKGSIPGFVKNIFSQGQGEVASRVDGCLKQLRAKKGK